MLLEKYLGNIAPVFFAHAAVGYGMTDIPKFLRDDAFRAKLVQKARLFIRQFWQDEYASLSASVKRSETASLATRLNRFLRSPIAGNIIGQSRTTIDFRKAIEHKEILLIHLPVKTLKEDASLIGTMLVAQIHAAIFSFADTALEKRPGFSLFVDEFQHFATLDFAEMFTEGRKFGSRVAVAHQFRDQLPDYLTSATLTARTIVTFQATQEDAGKMARLYPGEETIDVETLPREVFDYLLKNDHPDEPVSEFTKYLSNASHLWDERRQLIKIKNKPSYIPFDEFLKRTDFPDSRHVINDLLYRCMREGRSDFPLPPRAVHAFLYILGLDEGVKPFVRYDPNPTTAGYILMGAQADSSFSCTQAFQDLCSAPTVDELMDVLETIEEGIHSRQQAALGETMDFIGCLRGTMEALAVNPLGEKAVASNIEVATQISNLPRGHAFVKIGSNISELATLKTPKRVSSQDVIARKEQIRQQTRSTYCRPASEVEQEIQQRLGLDNALATLAQSTDGDQTIKPGPEPDWQPFDEV